MCQICYDGAVYKGKYIVSVSSLSKPDDQDLRLAHSETVHALQAAEFEVGNARGIKQTGLTHAKKDFYKADGFLFAPKPTIGCLFRFISILTGAGTNDAFLQDKHIAIDNHDGSWNKMLAFLEEKIVQGTVKPLPKQLRIFTEQDASLRNRAIIDFFTQGKGKSAEKIPYTDYRASIKDTVIRNPEHGLESVGKKRMPYYVAVYCSAYAKDPALLNSTYRMCQQFAPHEWGLVSGVASVGCMYAAHIGAKHPHLQKNYQDILLSDLTFAHGSSVGATLERIFSQEQGTPQGMDEFWLVMDIYLRQRIMIDYSDASLIAPGGVGTVQELLGILNALELGDTHEEYKIATQKPIVIINPEFGAYNMPYWGSFLQMIDGMLHDRAEEYWHDKRIVTRFDEAIPALCEMDPRAADPHAFAPRERLITAQNNRIR